MEKRWTDGKYYERTKRIKYQENKQIEKSAYMLSLNYDENNWEILNKSIYGSNLKKEQLNNNLQSRELIQQNNLNPFLSKSNYVEDISISDQFLKPINTSNINLR